MAERRQLPPVSTALRNPELRRVLPLVDPPTRPAAEAPRPSGENRAIRNFDAAMEPPKPTPMWTIVSRVSIEKADMIAFLMAAIGSELRLYRTAGFRRTDRR